MPRESDQKMKIMESEKSTGDKKKRRKTDFVTLKIGFTKDSTD